MAAVRAAFEALQPDVVLNCAAWTDVDGAEARSEEALAVNGEGAGNVARAAAEQGAWIVHVSSDYVFSGCKTGPYLESDPTDPLSAYGCSKLAGELAVADAAPGRHTIVRSSWLFGTAGRCFPATILRLAAQRDELTVVADQIGCPTFTRDLAAALTRLSARPLSGVIHIAADGACSWFEFATAIVERAGLQCSVIPGRTEDLGRPAARPAYSVLGSERMTERLPHWRDGLWQYMAELTDMVGAT
jgi:dTDP-4-dehydrorhamnose reductase